MKNGFYVYTCGPMAAVTHETALGWRVEASKLLAPAGITTVSPTREKGMFQPGEQMGVDYLKYGNVPELTSASIITRDRFDVEHADILLANFNEMGYAYSAKTGQWGEVSDVDDFVRDVPIPSLGSDFELAWAYMRHVPIVLVAKPDNYYRKHPFAVETADIVFDELEQACTWIVKNFGIYTGVK